MGHVLHDQDYIISCCLCRDGSGCSYTIIQQETNASVLQGQQMELARRKFRLHTRQL